MEYETLPHDAPIRLARSRRIAFVARRLARALLLLLLLCVAGLVLVAVLVAVQSQYVDLRQADAIMVLDMPCDTARPSGAQPCPQQALLEHALDLYRRGLAQRLLLSDNTRAGLDYLRANGVPEPALLIEHEGSGDVRLVAEMARANGISSVLLVGVPYQMLRGLKMVRDHDLVAYAAPLPARVGLGDVEQLRAIARESGAYWRYVLFGA
jgi:hypothetical protein